MGPTFCILEVESFIQLRISYVGIRMFSSSFLDFSSYVGIRMFSCKFLLSVGNGIFSHFLRRNSYVFMQFFWILHPT